MLPLSLHRGGTQQKFMLGINTGTWVGKWCYPITYWGKKFIFITRTCVAEATFLWAVPIGFLFFQTCLPGFYRLRSEPGGRTPGPTLGTCVPCQCNGHSSLCDPETSICQVGTWSFLLQGPCEMLYAEASWSAESMIVCACEIKHGGKNNIHHILHFQKEWKMITGKPLFMSRNRRMT